MLRRRVTLNMATVTATVTDFVVSTVTKAAAAASTTSGNRAAPQAGVLEGASPVAWSKSNPIQLFIVQVSHFHSLVLQRLPRILNAAPSDFHYTSASIGRPLNPIGGFHAGIRTSASLTGHIV